MFEEGTISPQKRSVKELVLLLLSGTLATAITPFVYIRLRDAQWTMAFFELGIVCIMSLLFLLVYVSRRTRTAGVIMALAFIAAGLMTALLLGVNQVYWAYPALVVSFFMLDTRQASILSGGFVCCFLAILWDDVRAIDLATICLTLITTILLAYAFALTARRQHTALRRMANADPLTGAGNRRAQNQKLDSVNAIFRRTARPASALILDVDYFKKVNDTHGHVIGDQILVDIADLVRRHTRATETLYRYGGEEFVVIAEQTGLQAAANLAEKLREMVDRKNFSSGVRLTVSIGVAEVHPGEGRQGWLNRADTALFEAKTTGRNRVVLADPPPPCLQSVRASKPMMQAS
jgi:diguanylate cyclase (GGDEF)-like protein